MPVDDPLDPLAALRKPKSRAKPARSLGEARAALVNRLAAIDLGRTAALVGAGLVMTLLAWWMLAPPTIAVEERLPIALVAPPVSAVTSPAPGDPAVTVAPGYVHVVGAVRSPGLVRIDEGDRVIDAIEAADGVSADADLERVNLAARVVDGERLYVPRIGEAAIPGVVTGALTDATGAGPINVNTATAEQLQSLPGVGAATAKAIVSHREQRGPFGSPVDLLDVPGIGDAKLAAMRELVTV